MSKSMTLGQAREIVWQAPKSLRNMIRSGLLTRLIDLYGKGCCGPWILWGWGYPRYHIISHHRQIFRALAKQQQLIKIDCWVDLHNSKVSMCLEYNR